ncbi:MAG: aminodeoxychorismate synthase component I [Bacteroidetes bacterium HGW-Bacteroidetes-7]|jgi:para-aminobenzoate synthetase component 1|nr:MAG: aminodeoxychorismate synthase component I [Bacteroidetes bacterium HGW-Bacteroidetes-7]
MIKATEVRELMNRYGAERVPFLFAVDFELEKGIFELNPLESKSVLFRVGAVENYSNSQPGIANDFSDNKLSDNIFFRDNQELLKIKTPPDKTEYKKAYDTVMAGLMRGDTYLINLTKVTEISTPLTFEQIIANSTSPYALCIPDNFVCFSPERFVRIEKGVITSCPMKGTIDATIPGAKEIILSDYKESCEHNTITDLIRNDIGAVSKRVWVERFRYTENIATDRGNIIQVSSDIRGEIKDEFKERLGDIIFSLLPAGSVSGAPKPSTLRLISNAEGSVRGFYTGIFGYFDGETLDSAVLIRFIEKGPNGKLFYRSGGGITVNSNWESEYEEVLKKVYLPVKL